MSLMNIFSFLVREMLSTYANEIKLRTLFFLNFHQNMYSFVDLIYLYLTYFLIGECFILNNSTFYEFVLIFLLPGMALSYEAIFFIMCTIEIYFK